MSCIVCDDAKKKKIFCPSCQQGCCLDCQEKFGKVSCVSCEQQFTENFLKQNGFDKLIKTILRPQEENLFWEREKALLSSTQALVDWEIQVEQLSKQLRFGFQVQFPPKPYLTISSTGSSIFPCPSTECRGFILPSDKKCGSCKKQVCLSCRDFIFQDNHHCKSETLETLALLSKDCKECPKCSVLIFRTEGCLHMFCTHCRTHFDWATKKILSDSTNHHYDKSPLFSKLKTRENDCTSESVYNNKVSPLKFSEKFRTTDLYRWLYLEPKIIRDFLRTRLNTQALFEQHDQALIKIRMQYLRKIITEETAKKKIFLLEKNYETKLFEKQLLEDFLYFLNEQQHDLYLKSISNEDFSYFLNEQQYDSNRKSISNYAQVQEKLQEGVKMFSKCLEEGKSKIQFKLYEGPLMNL